jgi:hypothetical protein
MPPAELLHPVLAASRKPAFEHVEPPAVERVETEEFLNFQCFGLRGETWLEPGYIPGYTAGGRSSWRN